MRALTVATLFSFLLCRTLADNHNVTFLYPISGLTLHYNDSVNVSYTSSFQAPQLYTFCTENGKTALITELVQTDIPAYNGTQTVQLTYPNAISCYFDLRPSSTAGQGRNSESITILPSARATPITASLSSPPPSISTTPKSQRSRIAIIVAISVTTFVLVLTIGFCGYLWWQRKTGRGYTQAGRGRNGSANVLQAEYIDQVDQKWNPGAPGEYIYVRPMQSCNDFRQAEARKPVGLSGNHSQRHFELEAYRSPIELGSYSMSTASPPVMGERYEARRFEVPASPLVVERKEDRTFYVEIQSNSSEDAQKPQKVGNKRFSWQ